MNVGLVQTRAERAREDTVSPMKENHVFEKGRSRCCAFSSLPNSPDVVVFCCPPPSLLSLFVYTTNRTYYWSASIAISKHRLVTLLYAYALHFTWALPNIRTSFPPPSHQYTYYATMKLSTAATAMIVSVTVLSLPATVTASTSKTSKQTKGGSYSMSTTTTLASNSKSKASKQGKGNSSSMSINFESIEERQRR